MSTLFGFGINDSPFLSIFIWSSVRVVCLANIIMPRCTMHRRHTVVRSCVGLSVCRFIGLSVCQMLHIFMSGELQVLKVGQYAKNGILVR